VRDTRVLRFNASAEPGFGKRDSKAEKRDSENKNWKTGIEKRGSKVEKTRFGKWDLENWIQKTGLKKTGFGTGKNGF
jgi:hypothetical protein